MLPFPVRPSAELLIDYVLRNMLDAPVNKERAVQARRAAECPSPQINADTRTSLSIFLL